MNDCRTKIADIHLLVENELSPASANELKKHIAACPSCSKEYDKFLKIKQLLEDALAAKVNYHDSEQEIITKVEEADSLSTPTRKRRRILKGFLILAAASLAAIFSGVYLFAHIYLQKTFSYQLSQTINRCSSGIEKMSAGSGWQILKAGDQMERGAILRTPANKDSFMSFDRIRLLAKGEAQLEVKEHRTFILKKGEVFFASGQSKKPLEVAIGKTLIETNDGAFRIASTEGNTLIGVTSGAVDVTEPNGKKWTLFQNQIATFHENVFSLNNGKVKNPFEQLRISVLDRIKERFAKVMAQYSHLYRLSRELNTPSGILRAWENPCNMLKFASYDRQPVFQAQPRLAQASDDTLNTAYDSLFVPSNRTLSIGTQRPVPLGREKAASLPAWSHDGKMIAYTEYTPLWWPTYVKVARLDDLDNPWTISQELDFVRPMFPVAWTPDNRHVIFQAQLTNSYEESGLDAEYGIKIAPIDPAEGPLRDFKSPLPDIPFQLPIAIGGTISPCIVSLPWGDAILCANWGNVAYIPIEPDGTPVPTSRGLFLTNFYPRDIFVVGVHWSPSANKIIFMGVRNIGITSVTYDSVNVYILYDVDDILDGFTQPPRSIDDPRIKHVSPTKNSQYTGGFSFDESLVFYQEDVTNLWQGRHPTDFSKSDFDLFYADATRDQPSKPTQIHLPGNQMFLRPSPEGNRLAYCNFDGDTNELRVISFGVEADMNMDLGGVIIDNSGTNLIVPPGALEENFKVTMSTPLSIEDEALIPFGENRFFAMRLLDARGLENPKFIEPMILTIRYTDEEAAGLDESMLDIYYYDETEPKHPKWVPMGGTVDPEYNEITVEIRHFSKFAIGGSAGGSGSIRK